MNPLNPPILAFRLDGLKTMLAEAVTAHDAGDAEASRVLLAEALAVVTHLHSEVLRVAGDDREATKQLRTQMRGTRMWAESGMVPSETTILPSRVGDPVAVLDAMRTQREAAEEPGRVRVWVRGLAWRWLTKGGAL